MTPPTFLAAHSTPVARDRLSHRIQRLRGAGGLLDQRIGALRRSGSVESRRPRPQKWHGSGAARHLELIVRFF